MRRKHRSPSLLLSVGSSFVVSLGLFLLLPFLNTVRAQSTHTPLRASRLSHVFLPEEYFEPLPQESPAQEPQRDTTVLSMPDLPPVPLAIDAPALSSLPSLVIPPAIPAPEAGVLPLALRTAPQLGEARAPSEPPVAHSLRVLRTIRPRYPLLAKRMGIEGTFRVKLLVSEKGAVSQLEILSRPPGAGSLFDASIKEALLQWRFEPLTRGGEAVSSWVENPIVFELE